MGGNSKSSAGVALRDIVGLPSEQTAQEFATTAKYAGYTGLPTIATGAEWDKAVADSDFGIIYRGVSADSEELLSAYTQQLRNGDFYMMSGSYGYGMYGAYDTSPRGIRTGRESAELYLTYEYSKVEQVVFKKGTVIKDYYDEANKLSDSGIIDAKSKNSVFIRQGIQALVHDGYAVILDRSSLIIKGD